MIPAVVCRVRRFCVTHVVLEVILLAILDSIVTIGLKSRGFCIPMSGNNTLSAIIIDRRLTTNISGSVLYYQYICRNTTNGISIYKSEWMSEEHMVGNTITIYLGA